MSKLIKALWNRVDSVVDSLGNDLWMSSKALEKEALSLQEWLKSPEGKVVSESSSDMPIGSLQGFFQYAAFRHAIDYGTPHLYGSECFPTIRAVVRKAVFGVHTPPVPLHFSDQTAQICIEVRKKLLSLGLPFLPQRLDHLHQLLQSRILNFYNRAIPKDKDRTIPVDDFLLSLIQAYPGFGEDMLLKRAISLILEFWNSHGHFREFVNPSWGEEIKSLPVPIDSHIPNVLRLKGILVYSLDLATPIQKKVPFPQYTKEELQIRCASAYACKRLAEKAGVGPAEVQAYLLQFKEQAQIAHPPQMVITTDY